MTRTRVSGRRARQALAERAGILPQYVDQTGVVRHTSESTRVALLAAMGFPADTEARARASLRALATADASRLLAPSRVVPALAARTVPIRMPSGRTSGVSDPTGRRSRWVLEIRDEVGAMQRAEGVVRADGAAHALRLPFALGPGYYRLALRVAAKGGEEHAAEQTLVVTPGRCVTAEEIGLPRVYGLIANLYTLRSGRNWGAGDLSDLADLVGFTGAIGGAFVGINPLHALANVDHEISPYSPLSRLYRNPLYLDVTAVPELHDSPAARRRLASPKTRATLARLRAGAHVDYAGVMAEKDAVLRELHRTFAARHRGRATSRGKAYARYCEREGEGLVDFATFLVLRGHGRARRDWHRWREAYRDHHGRAVRAFRVEHAEAVDYHCWVQFELDRQLGAVAQRARGATRARGLSGSRARLVGDRRRSLGLSRAFPRERCRHRRAARSVGP